MPSSRASTASSKNPRQCSQQTVLFIDNGASAGNDTQDDEERVAQKKSIRAQAARASSNARLETIRKRAEERGQQPGQAAKRSTPRHRQEPLALVAVQQHRNFVAQYQSREASAALYADTLFGGPIPVAQANEAIIARFLNRFATGHPSERPWTEIVMAGEASLPTPTLERKALQANATALYANDLNSPDVRRHATRLYLSTITQLQAYLRSPQWHLPVVMYTCMIISLYDCIESNDTSAHHAHISGVAHLIEQKGPRGFINGMEHTTFRHYRINIFMLCTAVRRPCFLAETEWRTIPFSGDDCPPKTILDTLVDILVEIPGMLAAAEGLGKAGLSRYDLLKGAFALGLWVRRLLYCLERWKADYIWTHPTICTTSGFQNFSLLELCELATGLTPYDSKLAEALNCYMAAHLITTRVALKLCEINFIVRNALRPPYSLRDLVAAIALVSDKHTSDPSVDMVSMMVTTFPLKAAQSTTELDDEPDLFGTIQELLDRINEHFASRYNINYTVARTREFEV